MAFFSVSSKEMFKEKLGELLGKGLMGSGPVSGPIALTIGNFDGIHLGHQELVKSSVQWAKQHKGNSIVLTFQPHPVQVLFPEKAHNRLFDLNDQKEQLVKLGVLGLFLQPFSREFSELDPSDFLGAFMLNTFNPSHITVGYDFSFGKSRSGGHDLLKEFCHKSKIDLQIIPPVKIKDEIISTSLIRQSLMMSDLKKTKSLLGRNYYLRGVVIKGDQRGRTLGFPTANIKPTVDFIPKIGVYASRVSSRHGEHHGMTNIGLNPTFIQGEGNPVRIETHILSFNHDLYGEEITVELVDYLREEKKFPNKEALIAQINLDIQNAKDRS